MSDQPLSFDTVKVVDGVRYEHLHTKLIARDGDQWIVEEFVLIDGVMTSAVIALTYHEHDPESPFG